MTYETAHLPGRTDTEPSSLRRLTRRWSGRAAGFHSGGHNRFAGSRCRFLTASEARCRFPPVVWWLSALTS